jgi:hypothetical protein
MSMASIIEVLAIQGVFAERMKAGDKQIDVWLERGGEPFARAARVTAPDCVRRPTPPGSKGCSRN